MNNSFSPSFTVVQMEQIVVLSWNKDWLTKRTLSFYYPAAHFWKEKQKIKMQFHSQNAGKRKRFAWQSSGYSRIPFVSEDAQCWPKPPPELQGWILCLSTRAGSGAWWGKERQCSAGGLCTWSKFQIMRNKPICNMNYCQLLPQNSSVENITASELILYYFHVFTLRIHADTFVIKVLTNKSEANVTCDLWYTQIYQDKENYPEYPELKKSHSFIEFRYCDNKEFAWTSSCSLNDQSLCPESLCPGP